MHFRGPSHLRAQAIVLHASLELCLQVVHEAYMRRSQPEASVVSVMAVATKRKMGGYCAVNMLSMRAHSRLNGIIMRGLC